MSLKRAAKGESRQLISEKKYKLREEKITPDILSEDDVEDGIKYEPDNANMTDPLHDHSHMMLTELTLQVKNLVQEIKDLKKQMAENKTAMTNLIEEVHTLKMENRKFNDPSYVKLKQFKKLPFKNKNDFQKFDEELQKNEELLEEFKQFIAKTGGDGPSQFIRAAVRKVFDDELACAYSWKGTAEKPSAAKSFAINIIKNICHKSYEIEDQRMNSIFQGHFVHASDRLKKRKYRPKQ